MQIAQAHRLMYKFSWNTRGFSSERSKSPAANTALCPTSESADKVEVALLEYRYRFYGSSCTELRPHNPSSPIPSLCSVRKMGRENFSRGSTSRIPRKVPRNESYRGRPRASWPALVLPYPPPRFAGEINSPLGKFRTNLFLRRVNTRTFVSWILLFFVHVFFVRVRRSRFLINDIIALAILERERNFIFSSLAMIWKFNSVLGSTGCIIFEHSGGKITFRKVPI